MWDEIEEIEIVDSDAEESAGYATIGRNTIRVPRINFHHVEGSILIEKSLQSVRYVFQDAAADEEHDFSLIGKQRLGESERLSRTRDSADVRRQQRHSQDENSLEGAPFTGHSRVSPFHSPNVVKQQVSFPPKFIEQENSNPDEFRYRYSSNDLRSSPAKQPQTLDYPRRGSEGYLNVNVRKSTPFPNPTNEFTVMTLEHNVRHPSNLTYLEPKYLNGNRSDEDDNETGHENFVDESEDIESKKSSAGSSTRDSGVSSLKSAGRMLTNGSPPSTGERGGDEVEEVEIPELEHENDEYENELPVTPKTPSSRGSESERSPTVTNQISRLNLGSTEEPESRAEEPKQFRPVENSPPPTPRLANGGGPDDYILRKPVLVRSSPKNKIPVKPRADEVEEQRRASKSPSPMQYRTHTPSPVQNSYRSIVADDNGRNSIESRNGHYRASASPKTPEIERVIQDDYEEDFEVEEGTTDSSRNSRESTSSQPQGRTKLPQKCFLKKGLTTTIPPPPRRVFKGSFRESNSQRNQNASPEVYPADMKPLDSPRHGFAQGVQKLASPEWEVNLEGFRLIVRLIRHNQEFLVRAGTSDLHNIILAGLRQLGNLRSQVCRAACLFFKELFTHIDPQSSKGVEQNMEKILEKLLDKSMDTNKFIREDSGSALDSTVMAMQPQKCIAVLDNYGTKHRNAIVRRTTARLLGLLIKKLGTERILNEYPEKALPMLVRFLQEGNLETRTHAKSSLSFLAQHPSFDVQLRRNVPYELLRHSDKAINTLKNDLKFARRSSTHRL